MIATGPVPVINLLSGIASAERESIALSQIRIESPGDLATFAEGQTQFLRDARSILIDTSALRLSEADVSALTRAASYGVRVIAAGPHLVPGFPPLLAQFEPDFKRAVIAAIYGLQPGQRLVIVSPAGETPIRGLVSHALRWRASWRDVEDGDFSWVPMH